MSIDELKEQLGDELCDFCPWKNNEIEHAYCSLCEGLYCNEACENFIEDNQEYFDCDE